MKSINITVLTIALISMLSTSAFAQYDDVYYDPAQDPGINQSGDFEEDYYNEQQQTGSYSDGYSEQSNRVQEPSNSESYYDEEGNTYVTNNYYDYSYSSRLRRFYNPSPGFGYYADVYTNTYFYTHDPYYYGSNIYVSAPRSWWRPRRSGVYVSLGWGSPYPYRMYNYYDYYPNYWSYRPWGYNSGYNAGYWAGYNDGYWGNNYDPYGYNYCPSTYYSPGYAYGSSGNVYYGPRNGGRVAGNNAPNYSSESYINKSNKIGNNSSNPVKTDHGVYSEGSPMQTPDKGVKTTTAPTSRPNGDATYVNTKERTNESIKTNNGPQIIKTKTPSGSDYSRDPKSTQEPKTTTKTPVYTKPKSTYENTKSDQYNKPTAPTNTKPSGYTKPNTTKSDYSTPKSNSDYSTPKSNSDYSTPKSNSNYSKPNSYSKPKTYTAPASVPSNNKSDSYTAPKSNKSYNTKPPKSSYKAPKSNNWNSGSNKTYSAPKNTYSAPKSSGTTFGKTSSSSSKSNTKTSSGTKFSKKK